ncbi:uncharacterized protein LOC143888564 [Tasmannia lanceolata]|uniref:uncharacterized protein LOC143888564 n=1 Tax=Tasmannia lanceolata TaxID=3420 RepID=UPI004063B535
MAEILSRLLAKGSSLEMFKGFKIGGDNVEVSHLQFVDDTLLFCEPHKDQVLNLKATLRCYELISGQRSNFHKSKMYALNIPSAEALEMAGILGCDLDYLPASYLGLPLGVSKPDKTIWEPIIEKIGGRLDTWKRNIVSRGGRLVLIKVVLANLPIYFMSLFMCPVSVALRIEKIQHRFLWGGNEEKKGISLVNWSDVCVPIKFGSLGIRRFREFNHALLGKWLWRFGEEQSNLCGKVICSKYGCIPCGWESKDEYKKKGLTAWRDILKLACSFNLKVRFRVYGGDRIKFWSDVWCEDEQLRILFPRLYRVAVNKEAFVCECFDRSGALVISWVRCLPSFLYVSAFDLWEHWMEVCFSTERKINIVQRCEPLMLGMLKINFDGAFFGNPGTAGVGGLCRDEFGEILWAFSGPIGVCDSSEAEVKAAYFGIKKLSREVLDHIIVEGDSLNVIRWLKSGVAPPWRFLALFDEIEDFVAGSAIVFNHVWRSANEKEDGLAKQRVGRESILWFDHLPP